MRTRSVLLALVLAALAGPSAVSADVSSPWLLDPGQQATTIEASFFSADTYHRPDGERGYLAGGGLAEQRAAHWVGQFGWKKWSNVYFDVSFVSATRRLGGTQPEFLRTSTAFGDAHFGMLIPVARGASPITLQLDWKTPFGYDRDPVLFQENDALDLNAYAQSRAPVLGDGQHDFSGLVHLGLAVGDRGFWQGGAGYTYRMESPADRIELRSDAGLWLGDRLLVTGRYRGGIAAEGDNETRDASRHLVGGGLLYRVADHMDIYAGSLHTAAAENALHTDEIIVGFTLKQSKLNRSQGYLGTTARP